MVRRSRPAPVAAALGAVAAVSLLAFQDPQAPRQLFRQQPVEHWIALLDDLDPDLQNLAAYAVGRFGPRAAGAVPSLLRMLAAGETTRDISPIRSNAAAAAEALGHVRVASTEVVNALLPLARRAGMISVLNRQTAAAAVTALGRLGAVEAVPTLIEILQKPARPARNALDQIASMPRLAAEALGAIGPRAQAAIPALREIAADDSDMLLSLAARRALEKIGG